MWTITAVRPLRLILLSLLAAMIAALGPSLRADVPVYAHAPDPSGARFKSSWYAPDGMDNDEYVWDAFTLPTSAAITQIQWRGCYTNYLSGAGIAPVYNFTVSIYASIAGNFQPDVTNPPLYRRQVNGNAGETPVGTAGGVSMYDYHFVLPSPFQAVGGTKYWIQIEAWQGVTPLYYWPPDWSIARGTGGDNSHFRKVGGTGGNYAYITGDCTFTLLTSGDPAAVISTSVSPAAAGTVSGGGSYPIGSVATLTAIPATGFGFLRWTEGGSQVSTSATYSFTVAAARTLIAEFAPAYTVTTGVTPIYGGTAAGGGTFNEGASVTLTATAAPGFVFSAWTEFGTPVSGSSTYTFTAAADTWLIAEFVNAPNTTTFDFDDAPVHTSLPVSLVSSGLGATLSGTGSGFSIQPFGTVGLAPAGMSGLYIYPNSVFPADLVVDFSAPLTDFRILYSPQELGCDNSATMRVTAFMNGSQVGTATTTAPVPGSWPTGTASISVPTGFNRAVVHWDSRPPTCQDYGPIFIADNMTVTLMCQPAVISAQPVSLSRCPTGYAEFSVAASGTQTLAYQWQLETTPGNWINFSDGALPYNGGTIVALGAASSLLQLSLNALPGAPAINFRCIASNPCGSSTSAAATLTIACPSKADVAGLGGIPGCDGQLTVDDIVYFLAQFFANNLAVADIAGLGGTTSPDGQITVDDLVVFLSAFFAGCP